MTLLRLPENMARHLRRWAALEYPNEACGLLVGRADARAVEVCSTLRARNVCTQDAGARFAIDPDSLLAADDAARREGLDVVGVWHTHPDQPARPTERDRRGAWPGWSYLIISVGREGVDELRSWRLAGQDFVEERLES